MKTTVHVSVLALTLASAAHAQQAVQWKLENGGNGHWYATTSSPGVSWSDAASMSALRGGALATLTTAQENNFVVAAFQASGPRYPWIGLRQSPDAVEPGGGWAWVSGEPLSWTNWSPSEPNGDGSFDADQANIWLVDEPGLGRPLGTWNDWHVGGPDGYMIEWSADCNGDGFVDYGQCRDGSLADYDADNVPDCCENGDPCAVGIHPVQWRVTDGGNGHWYRFEQDVLHWQPHRDRAVTQGGYLASVTSPAERNFVGALLFIQEADIWLGGQSNWPQSITWVSGEPFAYTASFWCPPNGYNPGGGYAIEICGRADCPVQFCWNVESENCLCWPGNKAVYEWSADCNNDGVVDFGQILQGQLADLNADGVPDACQQPTCADADIYRDFNVNGADLGILLSQWGPITPLTESDLNGDGVVDGADLGLLLSFWGGCP